MLGSEVTALLEDWEAENPLLSPAMFKLAERVADLAFSHDCPPTRLELTAAGTIAFIYDIGAGYADLEVDPDSIHGVAPLAGSPQVFGVHLDDEAIVSALRVIHTRVIAVAAAAAATEEGAE